MNYTLRRARDPLTGKNGIVDGNTTYNEWVKNMTPEQKQALEVSRKKDSNKMADKLQYARYKKVLGTEIIPRSFDKFQDLKYNDTEKWQFRKLDYSRQNRLIENPSLALPNFAKATSDDRKFTEYLFGDNHQDGLAKGKAFTSRLGYDIDNYAELKEEILKSASKYPVKYRDEIEQGKRYEQKIVLYGNKGKPANVVVGWCSKGKKTWMTSAYIKEIDR